MHYFFPVIESDVLTPIHNLDSFYYEWSEFDYKNDEPRHFLSVFFIVVNNKFKTEGLENLFSDNFSYVSFELQYNFLGYNLNILKLCLSNQIKDKINNTNKDFFTNFNFFRQENTPLHDDLKYISELFNNKSLLENF